MIMGDPIEFVSPVTGEVIRGRVAMNNHYKQHDVTHVNDFNKPGGHWDKKAQERAAFFSGAPHDRARRIEHIKRALEKTYKVTHGDD